MRVLPILAVLATALAIAARIWRPRRRPLALGREVVDAETNDRLHRERFAHLPSPLPPSRYARSETLLIDPQLSDLDLQIRSLVTRFASAGAPGRQELRDGATGEDFYTLLTFARRASVFALRDRDEQRIREALGAIAMIDAARIDEREIPSALALIHHSATRLQLPATELFDAAAKLAEARTAQILTSFVRKWDSYRDLENSWCHHEIETGFVRWDAEDYAPQRDLLRALLDVRATLGDEAGVTLATSLPPVWFPEATQVEARAILERSLGTGVVDAGTLRVYIVDAASDDDAAALHALAQDEASTAHDGPLFTFRRSVKPL